MNDLFEEMKYAYDMFCRTAQQFMDAAKEHPIMKNDAPAELDYKSWIGKVVYVWDDSFSKKQRALLLEYNANYPYPFRTAGASFEHAELCEDE